MPCHDILTYFWASFLKGPVLSALPLRASGLFAECGIPNGKAVIRNLIYKFITRLNESILMM